MSWRILAASVLAVCCGAAARAEDCKLQRVASLDMKIGIAGEMYVPITIHRTPVNMLIDTGGINSMLRNNQLSALDLHTRPIDLSLYRMKMVGGKLITQMAEAHDVVLGGLHADSIVFIITPDGFSLPLELGGTLAPDILSNFDVDFDMANAKVNLFSQDHCAGQVVYWTTSPVAVVPMNKNEFGQVDIDIVLDGKTLQADIDTGSTRSFMSYETARDLFGWTENDPRVKAEGRRYHYPFASLTFQGIAVNNPDIMLLPDKDIGFEMGNRIILGMGVLRQLHVYIAYRERKLYLSAADAH